MGLRDRKEQASETSKATKKIGLIAKLVVQAGIAPFGRGITNVIKGECFRPYSDEGESKTRQAVQAATEEAIKNLPVNSFQVGPVLNIEVVKDTSLTPTSRWKGNMYNMRDYDSNDRFTHKRHSDFILDHMSDEINDLEGKEFWAHVTWKNLPAGDTYGGDYSQIRVENNDELSIIITHLPNKRAATDLMKALRNGTTTTDDLCLARGYDVAGVKAGIRAALGEAKDASEDNPPLSDIGSTTKASYDTLQGFMQESTMNFLKSNISQVDDGDLEALAIRCGADVGDIAIALNKPEYFRTKMEATGLGEKDALVKVAKDAGLANVKDLAIFLNITEVAF